MKKAVCICLALALALLSACGEQPGEAELSLAPPEDERLVVYTSHKQELWWPIVREFEERTGIWVDVVTGGSNELLERISEEAESPRADVMFGGGVDTIEVYRDYLEPYTAEGIEHVPEDYRSEGGLWTPFSVLPVVIIYNTRLIDDGAVTCWQDLLEPAFRGKIAFADPAVSGSSFTSLVTMLYVMECDVDTNLRAFAGNLGGRELDSSGDVLTGVSDGSFWIGVTLEETALKRVDAGDSLRLVYPDDGTSLVPDGSAIVKGAAHPDNAKRFIDFTLSPEVQKLLLEQYRRPVRTDIALTGELPGEEDMQVLDYDVAWASSHHDTVLMSWAFYLDKEETA